MLLVNRESGAPRSDWLGRVLIVLRVITTPMKVSRHQRSQQLRLFLISHTRTRPFHQLEQVKTRLTAASRALRELGESLLGSRVHPPARIVRWEHGAT